MRSAEAAAPADERHLQEETIELLMELATRLRRHVESRAAEIDLSIAQAMTLRHLAAPTPMRELACHLGCDASNVTGIVDRLESRGLVERRVDPADRRIKNLVLTPAGREVRERLEHRLFEDLPFAREQQALLTLLRRILR